MLKALRRVPLEEIKALILLVGPGQRGLCYTAQEQPFQAADRLIPSTRGSHLPVKASPWPAPTLRYRNVPRPGRQAHLYRQSNPP